MGGEWAWDSALDAVRRMIHDQFRYSETEWISRVWSWTPPPPAAPQVPDSLAPPELHTVEGEGAGANRWGWGEAERWPVPEPQSCPPGPATEWGRSTSR